MLLPIDCPSQWQENTDSYWTDESRMNSACFPDSSPHADKNASCKVHRLFQKSFHEKKKKKTWHKFDFFPVDLSDMNNPTSVETDSW